MAIYTMKHPTRCAELLKYAEIVRMAAIQYPGLGWRTYDEQFRLMQESVPGRSWGNLDTELWLTVAAVSASSPTNSSLRAPTSSVVQPVGLKPPTKTGLCYAYNSTKGCNFSSCRFAHVCSKCFRGGHGAPWCRMAGLSRWVNAATRPPAQGAKQRLGAPIKGGQTAAAKQNFNEATNGKTISSTVFRSSNTN